MPVTWATTVRGLEPSVLPHLTLFRIIDEETQCRELNVCQGDWVLHGTARHGVSPIACNS